MVSVEKLPFIALLSKRKTVTAIAVVLAVLFATVTMTLLFLKTVAINDNGKLITVKTFKSTVEEVLRENKIATVGQDIITPAKTAALKNIKEIRITRAFPVNVIMGDSTKALLTTKDTVADLLKEAGIELGEKDVVNPPLETKLTAQMAVNITKVLEETITEQAEVPFKSISRPSYNLERGNTSVAQKGKTGISEKLFKVVRENGNIVSKELLQEKVTEPPVDELVDYGVVAVKLSSRGDSFRYSRVLACHASAYDLSYASCGKNPGDRGYGRTASGMTAQRGVIAVDPRVIPLGTRLYIEATDGSADYGYAVAGDTGGAIKGNKVDLFMPSHSEAIKFGRRTVNVYVLD